MAYNYNPNLLITGDFNYKEIDWINDYTPVGQNYLREFVDTLQDCFLYQQVTEPTRYRKTKGQTYSI